MTDEIERLKQQHREELDLAQEVIVNLRRDLAHAHKRIESQDAVWNDAIEAASVAAEGVDRRGRDWLRESVWDNIKRDTARSIEKLKKPMA
jgi:hypothetical protein